MISRYLIIGLSKNTTEILNQDSKLYSKAFLEMVWLRYEQAIYMVEQGYQIMSSDVDVL
jgi:hypothetical protein